MSQCWQLNRPVGLIVIISAINARLFGGLKGAFGIEGYGIHAGLILRHRDAYKTQGGFDRVGVLNSQGRAVLISLGGADAHIELHKGHEQPLANEIIRLVEVYGFDGLDIDLEQSAIDFADNKTVLPAALKRLKDHYKGEGKHFINQHGPRRLTGQRGCCDHRLCE